jgi:lycopene cyclase domain-containing protein
VNWLYLALNLGTVALPLAFSFDKRIGFNRQWPALFPALAITALFFLTWDFWFTHEGIWYFNEAYILGIFLVNLPLEEWMFFLFIPYACLFIHEALKVYFQCNPFEKHGRIISVFLAIPLLITGLIHYDRLYTAVTFLLLGTMLLFNSLLLIPAFMGRFFMTYLVSLIPFAVVNGILTSLPVLIYKNEENLSFRIGTIPVEDFFYSMLLLLINITLYEQLKDKRKI